MKWRLRWGQSLAWAVACVCSRPVFAETPTLAWEAAFPVEAAREDVYADAHFVGSDGGVHRLQLWRHGQEFLHRRTDAALDLYLHRAGARGDYDYRLVDHQRRVSMDVSRNQLYRIGVFSDWFGLAHVLERPKSGFVVRAVAALPRESEVGCSWRLMVRGSKPSQEQVRVCWSAKWGLPMSIRGRDASGEWVERFRVERVREVALSAGELVLPSAPQGYATFDAGQEIDPKRGD